jgi:hypothetical protein
MSLLLALVGGGASSQNIAPPLFVNQSTYPAATVTSTANLAPSILLSANAFYGQTVGASYAINAPLFVNGVSFYAPIVTSSYAIAPSLFTNSSTFYAPLVASNVNLSATLFANTNSYYTHAITQSGSTQSVNFQLYENTNQFPQHEIARSTTSGGAGNYFKPAKPRSNKSADRADWQFEALAKLKVELEQKEIALKVDEANKSDLAYQAIRKAQKSAKQAVNDAGDSFNQAAQEVAQVIAIENYQIAEIQAAIAVQQAVEHAIYMQKQAQIQKILKEDDELLQILAYLA